MLISRILTGITLAPLVALAVFYLPLWAFAIVFWAVAALACYEWAGLLGAVLGSGPESQAKSVAGKLAYTSIYGAAALGMWFAGWHQDPVIQKNLLVLGCVFWSGAFVLVMRYPQGEKLVRNPLFLGLSGLFVCSLAWLCLVSIRQAEAGSVWLIWILCLVWGADIGAYFGGRAWGKRPLAPQVSPAKTWEGVLGGYLLSGIVVGGAVLWWQWPAWGWVAATLVLIALAVLGDLFESVLKRATGVKDSGTILPGHGGMLDRVDSILAVLPFFTLMLLW